MSVLDMSFFDKLSLAIARNQSLLCVDLKPSLESNRYDRQTLPTLTQHLCVQWRQQLPERIAATAPWVCAYQLTLEFYTALGSAGLDLLQETITTLPPDIPIILDAKHSNLHTSQIFAETIFKAWQVDAVTLTPYTGQDHSVPFLLHPGKTVFILCAMDSPSAPILQEFPNPQTPFYLHLVRQARTWGPPEQVALEVGVSTPDLLARIRATAPERLILAHGFWDQGTDWEPLLRAGLDVDGAGLIVIVPDEALTESQSGRSLQDLRETVNHIREESTPNHPTCDLWMPDVCLLQHHPQQNLILQLFDIGCFQFGEFVQASGTVFPYYIDLRRIISKPQVFQQVLNAYGEILNTLHFDRIAGIPYGALPTASGLALKLHYPMIFPRKEVKEHGTRRLVEGEFEPGETVVVIEDVLITGRSAIEGARKLQSVGLRVKDIVVLIDHEGSVQDTLQEQGYQAHAVVTLSEISQTLYGAGRIDSEQFKLLQSQH